MISPIKVKFSKSKKEVEKLESNLKDTNSIPS